MSPYIVAMALKNLICVLLLHQYCLVTSFVKFCMDYIRRQVIHFAIISCRLMDSGSVYFICHPYLQISLYRSAQVLSNPGNLEFEDNLVWTSNWHGKSIGSIEHTCLVTVLSTFCTHCPHCSLVARENIIAAIAHIVHQCSLVAREKTIALQPTMEPTGLQILESSPKQIQIQKLSWVRLVVSRQKRAT
jgi:hypothetical protein